MDVSPELFDFPGGILLVTPAERFERLHAILVVVEEVPLDATVFLSEQNRRIERLRRSEKWKIRPGDRVQRKPRSHEAVDGGAADVAGGAASRKFFGNDRPHLR